MSEKVQYVIVGIIFLAAIIWAGVKASRIGKGKGDACCGCALSDACKKKKGSEKIESCEDKKRH